jgi:hypothetical protein
VETILEIGAATGDGSTRAFVAGADRRPRPPRVFCLEVVRERFRELEARYSSRSFVFPYNAASVAPAAYASEEEVRGFYHVVPSALNSFPLERVLAWRSDELAYLETAGVAVDGVERVRREHGLERFDVVLIDGSEFTAGAELRLVYGASWLVLDDVNSFKNHANALQLLADPAYELVAADPRLRNGYAIFRRR